SSGIVGSSGEVVSVDISDEMLHELETRSKSKGITNIEIQKINSVEDIEENNFDFILLIDVLQLIEEKNKMVNSLSEKLSNSGILLVKLEHLAKYQRRSLLDKLDNLDINHLTKDYWILRRKNVRMEK
ncbi:MAG: methyltransferase domain-containing protein, partial [Candidatus Thorarchaeota archaeon]|nr:methyltransferase domain-containing protein [Candidatus Thorarchaeota archaeon]